jgi:uncharacterized membrane protein
MFLQKEYGRGDASLVGFIVRSIYRLSELKSIYIYIVGFVDTDVIQLR